MVVDEIRAVTLQTETTKSLRLINQGDTAKLQNLQLKKFTSVKFSQPQFADEMTDLRKIWAGFIKHKTPD